MATSLATVTNPALGITLDFRFTFPTTAYPEFKLAARSTSTQPISAGAFNLQYLLDNFGPAKSRREFRPVHD